jgi:dynein heavy chain, axonemal
MIFSKVVTKFLGVFVDEVKSLIPKLVDATQYVYNGVEDKLKPIPAKSHYTFNLRDMSKIF